MRSPVSRSRPSNSTTPPVATASPVSVLTSTRSASRRTSPCSIWTLPSAMRSRSRSRFSTVGVDGDRDPRVEGEPLALLSPGQRREKGEPTR